MTLLSSELKNVGPWKKGENFFVFVRQYGIIFARELSRGAI